ncbi:MAG: hypothetical protein ACR2MY_11315 [Candidatus Dormibacteria bacterium]
MDRRWIPAVMGMVALAACGQGAAVESPAPSPVSSAPATAGPAGPPADAATQAPLAPFQRIELTDVRTGEHFNLGGLQGKQLIVEGMATW